MPTRNNSWSPPVLVLALLGISCSFSPATLPAVADDAGPPPGPRPGPSPQPSPPAPGQTPPIDGTSDAGAAGPGGPRPAADAAGAAEARPPGVDARAPQVDAGPPAPSPDAGPPRVSCGPSQACAGQQNCLLGFCEDPPATCGAIKSRVPSAPDGLYWLTVGAARERSYCDMATGEVLCSPRVGERNGRTREGSNLLFKFKSELLPGDQLCRIWHVRHATDGYPFNNLARTPGLTLDTCQALGFRRDGDLSKRCAYGRERTTCGYFPNDGRPYFLYGNDCVCVLRPDGTPQPRYVKEGPGIMAGNLEIGISVSTIPWNADGSVSATCQVQ
jgi:hypothetical protein